MNSSAMRSSRRDSRGRQPRLLRHVTAIALLCATAVVGQAVGGGSAPIAEAQATALGAGGEYYPLPPTRIFDSRDPALDSAPLGRKPTSPQGNVFNVAALGRGGVPADGSHVLAVVVNVIAVNPPGPGYLSIRPSGKAATSPPTSLVNFGAGDFVPNLAVVGVGPDGAFSIELVTPFVAGAADVVVDVYGWIATSSYPDAADSGGRFIPAGPGRILDTRTGPSPQPIGQGGRLPLAIRGAGGLVPNDPSITAVMVNITAVNLQPSSRATFVSATPDPIPAGVQPTTSNTNLLAGDVKASMAIMPIGADGAIHLYNGWGDVHLVVDVLGYVQRGVDQASTRGRVIPLDSPFRAFDTREPAFGSAPLGPGAVESWSFSDFVASVSLPSSSGTTPLGPQSALLGNLTGTGLGRYYPTQPVSTYLTMFPGDLADPPVASNLNVFEGESVPNMSLLRYGPSGTDSYVVEAVNGYGTLHYLLDVYAVVLS